MPEMSAAVVWLVAGLVLMLLEILTPGVFLMWLGMAAVGTGVLVQVLVPVFWMQVVIFTVLAAALIAVGLRVRRPRRAATINTPASGLIGRQAIVLGFTGQVGRVRVGDSDWSARLAHGVEAPAADTPLRVVGVDGTILVVGPG